MTIIVGIPHRGRVYMGGDARGTSTYYETRVEPKVWVSGDLVWGSAGSFRTMQILRYLVDVPAPPDDGDLWPWLVKDVVNAIREARKGAGEDTKANDGSESAQDMLLGVRGRLFQIERDYHVHEKPDGFAIGSGFAQALGSLHTSAAVWTDPRRRIMAAMEAACASDHCCGPPFTVVAGPRWDGEP